jgi:hypothetical protein
MDNVSESEPTACERKQDPPEAEHQLRSQAEEAKKQAADIKRDISEQAGASLETAKANLKGAAQKATGYGHNLIEEQKSRLAEIIHEYSHASEAASEKLHQEATVLWQTELPNWPRDLTACPEDKSPRRLQSKRK